MAINLVSSYKNWKKYRDTYNELMRLSQRELNDLGIDRSEIGRIAKQTAGY